MSEWVHGTVGEVTTYQKAGGTPLSSISDYYGGDIPFVVIEDMTQINKYLISTEKTLTEKGLKNSAAWIIEGSHILYSMYATVGKPVINQITCATNQAIIALKVDEKIDLGFLFYSLEFIRPTIWKFTTQTTQSNLNAAVVRKLPIQFPKEIDEQRKIRRILEAADKTIEKTEALIEKYQQIKAGLMHDLFTRGIGADGKLRPPREEAPELYQETAIGWIPRDWQVKKLDTLLADVPNNIRSGPFGSALLKSELVENGIPFLGIDNIFPEYFDENFKRFVSRNKFLQLSKYAVRPSDVVITIMGTVGRSALIPSHIGKALSSKHLWTMTFDTELVEPELICWQLNSAPWVKSWFRQQTQGGIMDAIQSKTLRNLQLPVPPKNEQTLLLERYLICNEKLSSETNALQKLEKHKAGLMQDLLTGKVQVNTPTPEHTPS